MNITNSQIGTMLTRLSTMGEGRKAPSDGRGLYLGDGSAFGESLRSGDLGRLLTELLAWRTQCSDFKYDEGTGKILYESGDELLSEGGTD